MPGPAGVFRGRKVRSYEPREGAFGRVARNKPESEPEMSTHANPVAGGAPLDGAPVPASQEAAGQRSSGQRRALGGILIRKECWTHSLRARLLVLIVCVGLIMAA